jgi:hypothetical protein
MIRLFTEFGEFNGLTGSDIVLTRAANNLTDLQSRQGDFTEVFELLPTHNNLQLIDNANEVTSTSNKPYININGYIEVDGEQIEGLFQLVSVGDVLRVRFFSGNTDFWQIIGNKKLRDLDLNVLNHQWLLPNIVASLTATSGYKYTATDYGGVQIGTDTLDAQKMLPSVFIHTIMEAIVNQSGYTKTGGVWTESEYLRLLQDLASEKLQGLLPIAGEANRNSNIANSSLDFEVFLPRLYYFLQFNNVVTGSFNTTITTLQGTFNATNYSITTPTFYRIELNIFINTIFLIAQTSWLLRVMRRDVIGELVIEQIEIQPTLGVQQIQLEVETDLLFIGEEIYFQLATGSGAVFELLGSSSITISPLEDAEIVYGGDWDIAANLPDVTQGEYFKQVGLLFGWQIETDVFNKVINAYKFEDVKDNLAVDLTGKIDYTEKPTIEFEFGNYAQINDMVYQDADNVEKPTGTDFVFNIPNEKLPNRAVVINSIWGATRNRGFGLIGFTTAAINKFASEIAPIHRILVDRQQTGVSITIDDSINTSVVTSIANPYFVDLSEQFNLGWQFLAARYYGLQIETLQQMKFVKMLMYLDANLFRSLKFENPIYADGSTYYLNELSQFNLTKKESTFVELIKLPI